MYHDYYANFATKTECENSLIAAELATDHEGQLCPTKTVSLDIIGVWYEYTVDVDGESVRTALPGYHANIRLCHELTTDQLAKLPITTTPVTPYRVWE